MPHFKDSNNQLHWLDSVEHEHLLPAGSVQITDAEADAIRAAEQAKLPNPRIAAIKAELAAIDQKRIRPLAEGDTAFLKTLNDQAIALRAELQTL